MVSRVPCQVESFEISTEQTFVITATHVYETLWELAETLQAMQVDAWGIRGFDLSISDRPLAALNPMRVHIRAGLHVGEDFLLSRDGRPAKRARASDAWQAALDKIDDADDADDNDDNCDDDNVEPPPGAAVGSDTDAPGEDEGYLSESSGEENIADPLVENEDTNDGDVDRLTDILACLDAADGRETGEERDVVREATPADAGADMAEVAAQAPGDAPWF